MVLHKSQQVTPSDIGTLGMIKKNIPSVAHVPKPPTPRGQRPWPPERMGDCHMARTSYPKIGDKKEPPKHHYSSFFILLTLLIFLSCFPRFFNGLVMLSCLILFCSLRSCLTYILLGTLGQTYHKMCKNPRGIPLGKSEPLLLGSQEGPTKLGQQLLVVLFSNRNGRICGKKF